MGQADARTVPLDAPEEHAALAAQVASLRTLFDILGEGVTVQSPSGVVVYANAPALRAMGFPTPQALASATAQEMAARWDVLDETGRPVPLADLPGRHALQGREAAERTLRFRVRGTGEERWSVVKATPLRDASGRVLGALNFFRDVTEDRRLRERQAFLAEASALLGSTLEQPVLLADLARLAVPRLADGCAIDLVDDGGRLRQAALAHVDPAKVELGRAIAERWPPAPDAPTGAPEVVRTGHSLLVRDVPEEALAAAAVDEEHRRMLLATEPRSCMIVPLKARGRVLGAMTFTLAGADARRYGPEDVAFAEELAARAAISLDNARLFAEGQAAHARRGAVLDASLDAIVSIDARGRVTEWNPAAERIFGWSRGEVVGRDMADVVIPPEMREDHRRGLSRAVGEGRSRIMGQRLELLAIRRDGSRFPTELAIVPVPTPGGMGFTGFLRDITDRKRSEETLRLQKTLLAAQMEAVLDGILILADDGQVVSSNRRFGEVWDLPEALLVRPDAAALQAAMDERVADPGAFQAAVDLLRADPSRPVRDEVALRDGRVLDRYGAIIRDPAGAQHGFVWTFRDITARKRSDETLKRLVREVEAERVRLDTIVRSVPGVVWEAWGVPDAASQRIDFVSDHVEKMLGYSAAEWLGTPNFWLTIVHPDDQEHAAAASRAHFESGAGGTVQFRWRRADGRYIWVQAWNTVILDAEGRPVGMRGVTMDVTERKQAEETQARLAAIVQDSEDAIYAKTLDGVITEWNPGAERLYGWTREEAVGMPVRSMVPADRAEEEADLLSRVGRGERLPPFETERLRKNGTRLHVSLTVSPIRDASGRAVGASVIARDVSEKKRVERAAARLAAIVLDSGDAIYTKTLDGRVTEWNPGAERLYGWTREEIIGQPIETLVPPSRLQEERSILERIAAGQRVEPFETERVRKDGTVFPASVTASPLRDASGIIVGVSAIARDVTERRRAERELAARAEELARLAEALERSNRELDQFAYVTSHDLKAPLRGIANLSRWLEEDLGDKVTPEARSHLDLLRGRVNRMEALIEAILEYSRVGRKRGKVETVDTRRLLEDVVDLLSPPRGFAVRLPAQMPAVRTDRARLQQVFMNLIGNAVKHHPDKERGVVSVGVEDAGAFWRFSVADNGRGIPKRFHEKVFAIFQTLEARDKVEGTGIGLAIVKKVVESKGGHVQLESDEGQGATFRFTWPKEEQQGEE